MGTVTNFNNRQDGQINLFDFFSLGSEATQPAPVTKPAKVVKTAETKAEGATGTKTSAKSGSKSDAKAKKRTLTKKVPGPVVIHGAGWTFTYGVAGQEYLLTEALKAAYDAGYKEVVISGVKFSLTGSHIFVDVLGQAASDDDAALGGDVSVVLGQHQAAYSLSNFAEEGGEAPSGDEVSVFDLTVKYRESHPEMKGADLIFDAQYGLAAPVLEKAVPAKKMPAGTYRFFFEDGVKELEGSGEELSEHFLTGFGEKEASVYFYRTEDNLYFAVLHGAETVTVSGSDIAAPPEEKRKTGTVKERYSLPATLYVERFGTRKKIEPEEFDGKTKIEEADVINYLKRYYRIFNSTSKKFDVLYDKQHGLISVAVISGTKGASS